MRYISFTLALIASFFAGPFMAQAEPQDQDDGIEVLARGPVHEAYAEPVIGKPIAMPIIPRQPPALLDEVPADQKPDGDVQWIPGYWAWDEDRNDFLWVSGFWRLPPPGRDWMPGHWLAVEGGWQWVPGLWAESDQEELAYYPPPPEPLDAGPSVPAPTATSVFVPGNWVYRGTRYAWRPGFWSDYRPGWVWIPAHYVWTPAGYLYVEGYWDHPLRERGLLFAPVAFSRDFVFPRLWSFRPRYIVNDECLLGALFVNPVCDHYYFGDYFDAGYRGRGFISWLDFRFGHQRDPLYGYYRSCYRADSHWEHGLRDLYEGRLSGELARPPRTLIQQNTVVQNITNTTTINNISNVTKIKNVTMLTPLAQVSPTIVRLEPVTEPARQAAVRVAQERRAIDVRRGQLESKLVAQSRNDGPAAAAVVKTTPQVRRVSLPRTQGDGVSAAVNAPIPLTGVHADKKPRLSLSTSSAKPPQVTEPSAMPAPKPSVDRPRGGSALRGKAPSVMPSPTTPSMATKPAAPAKPVSPQVVTQPSAAKAAFTPPARTATKHTSQPRVAHTPEPAAKPQEARKTSSKAQTAPKQTIRPMAPPAVKSPAPSAPKPAPRPAQAAKTSVQPTKIPPSKPTAKPQGAATPKPTAKPQAAPEKRAAQPPPKRVQPAVIPPSKPTAKPQAAATSKAAAKPQAAPTKPVQQPAPQSASKRNEKNRHN